MTKESLLADLERDGYLKTPALIEAFRAVDRAHFVPPERAGEAYGNYPLPIGHGQTISQPLTVAFMLELLDARPGERVLDIGAGAGWQTALLSFLVGEQGRVVAVERVPELAALAERNIAGAGLPTPQNVRIVLGDGSRGCAEEAPFDRIVAAAAGDTIPAAWKEQVKIGGRIVAPVRESIYVLDKTSHDTFEKRQYFGFSFVPLVLG